MTGRQITLLGACAGLAVLLHLVAAAQDAPPVAPTLPDAQRAADIALADAASLIEAGQVEPAIQSLQQIINDQAQDGVIRHAAAVVLDQITGGYQSRQGTWRNRKVVDALVLVPDEASFLAAIAQWDQQTFFPVLIDDGWYAPMFARAFAPAKVVRWSSSEKVDAAKLLDQLITQQNAQISKHPADAPPPPGLVVIDPDDPLRFAGAALALGRGQPAVGIDSPAPPQQTVDVQTVGRLNAQVMQTAIEYKLLGDRQWTAITLAGAYPYRYQITVAEKKEMLAVDDLLGREGRGLRLAVIGRLYGSLEQGIYQAMCSLFLQPRGALLFDAYPDTAGPGFDSYRLNRAAETLGQRFNVTMLAGGEITSANFRGLTHVVGKADGFDLIWINSAGHAGFWEMANGQHADPDDMPIGYPVAIHFVHSFSMQRLYDNDLLAGRALVGGAFWYFGSVEEPYLHAFMRPTGVAVKALAGTPLSFAVRHTPGHALYQPWKLMLVGDPLYSLRDTPAQRVEDLPLKDAETLTLAEATKLPVDELFRRVLVLRPDAAPTVAMKVVEQPDKLKPGELATAMWLLDETQRPELYAAVPAQMADKHPYASMLMRRSASATFEATINAGRPQSAQQSLVKLLQLETDRRVLTNLVQTWLAAMSQAGQADQAAEFLRPLADSDDLPRQARRAIQDVLAAKSPG